MPRTFDELLEIAEQKKKATGPKKPIEETSRVPNTPWMNLVAGDDNDINFDVDQKFKFRMPTSENFKGKDVKFDIKLPKDLLGDQPATAPAPRQSKRPARRQARRRPAPQQPV